MNWKNNIMGFIPQEEWLDVGFEVRRQNDPTDMLFGDLRTNNLVAYWQSIAAEYQIPMMAQIHGFDTEAKTTFRVPVDTHNVEKMLIKVKINQSERMREILRTGVARNEMFDYVINDGLRLVDQVVTRSKVAKSELMATGKITIKENNLNLEVDYGVPSAQTGFTLDLSADADVGAEIQKVIDAATDAGVTITGMMTSKKNLTKMRSNASLQKAINGNVGAGAQVRVNALLAYLEEEFDITQVLTNDLTYGSSSKLDKNGKPKITTSRYYPVDKITFFATNPGGQLGVGLWGDPPEVDSGAFYQVGTTTESPFVYVTQWMEQDPAVLWTKASGLFIPALFNPNSLWIATVQGE